ncbi:hypothetical protein DDIC_04985 [Desulfovibrio desulfuricans]|uniref:Glycine transporter domain-containing protein n=1 Tax=Desulfovibrio desulfuricans TaxID=876 RepID=A0A4P7UGG4_DESDE|nr:TRIC cation channel family protein [Desulfovibrio desulfuricans]QCC85243.1 hypothetical protein DDIC_04985 [Desulfovibrio desulfuricans]
MQNLTLFLLDLAASFVLAAAASCRARSTGAHFSGAAVLACLAGMAAPLARDGLLGFGAMTLNQGEYLAACVCGGIIGIAVGQSGRAWQAFFWLDALGLALGTGVATIKGVMAGLGPTGSILLGVLGGLAGGLVRDLCLGDMARAVEEDMYATAAALGGMLALSLLLFCGLGQWQSALCGAALVLVLRSMRKAKIA